MHNIKLLPTIMLSGALALTGCAGSGIDSNKNADTLFTNGNIYAVDEANTQAEAIAVKDGNIVYIGSLEGANEYKGMETKIVDLDGKFTMPAFVDSHLHPLSNSYAALFQVALFELTSKAQYLAAIQTFASTKSADEWIVGAGFDASVFGKQGPTKEVLDTILPDRAIAIVDRDIHSMLVNSKALALMGITKDTQDPVGGSIQRDANGNATGLLIDDSAMNLARGFFPVATKAEYKESLLWMQSQLNQQGITTAHDAWVEFDENYYQAFDELAKEGKLTVRYRGSWFVDPLGDVNEDIDYGIVLSQQFTHPHFQVNSFKFLTDNVLEQDSALLLDEDGGISGVRNWEQTDMTNAFSKVDKAGYQLHVHVVGDGGTRVTLDALEEAERKNGSRDSRHSLAHVEVADLGDIDRMGVLGLTAHLTTIGLEEEADVFEDSASKFHPVKSLIDAGVNVAIASDYATSDPDVMANIYGAMQRNNAEGAGLEEMLKAATLNGAYANFLESEVGSLEVGKKADFVVLSKDVLDIDTSEIPSVSIDMTYFEGKRVH